MVNKSNCAQLMFSLAYCTCNRHHVYYTVMHVNCQGVCDNKIAFGGCMPKGTNSKGPYQLRIPYLPRPEYYAMIAMVERWHLEDKSELFAVLVRLASEVMRYQDGQGE